MRQNRRKLDSKGLCTFLLLYLFIKTYGQQTDHMGFKALISVLSHRLHPLWSTPTVIFWVKTIKTEKTPIVIKAKVTFFKLLRLFVGWSPHRFLQAYPARAKTARNSKQLTDIRNTSPRHRRWCRTISSVKDQLSSFKPRWCTSLLFMRISQQATE